MHSTCCETYFKPIKSKYKRHFDTFPTIHFLIACTNSHTHTHPYSYTLSHTHAVSRAGKLKCWTRVKLEFLNTCTRNVVSIGKRLRFCFMNQSSRVASYCSHLCERVCVLPPLLYFLWSRSSTQIPKALAKFSLRIGHVYCQ